MFAYRIAYDGRPYRGFQRQPDVTTVEGRLSAALADLGVISGSRAVPPGYTAAGRTDAGVSALAQTVAFAAPEWLNPEVLSEALPDAIHVWARATVPDEFHATRDATVREYTYHLPDDGLDEGLLRAAATALSGYHDVHNLTADDGPDPRTTRISIRDISGLYRLVFRSPGFARQQVRRTVAAIRAIGAGEMPLDRVGEWLHTERIPGHLGIGPDPADRLILTDVIYPSTSFAVDRQALAAARNHLAEARRDATARRHVVDTLLDGLP